MGGDRKLLGDDEQGLKGAGLEFRTEIGTAAQSIEQDPDHEVRPEDQVNSDLIRLDIGCGQAKRMGFLGMDRVKLSDTDIVHDFTVMPWVGVDGQPLADSSVYEISTSHVMEHVKDLDAFMAEAYRVLISGGLFHVICPYWASSRAFQDPTHVRFMTEDTFRYYDRLWVARTGVSHYMTGPDFEQMMLKQELFPEEESYAEETKKWRVKHLMNVVFNIHYTLRAVKPAREFTPVKA